MDLRADDAEIGNYATLLDTLNIGLLVFAEDCSVYLRNSRADAILGDTPGTWEDENGRPLRLDDRPEMQALRTRQAVIQRAIGIRNEASGVRTWCTVSAFPVLTGDGELRCVLATLSDVSHYRRATSKSQYLPSHDPLTQVFNQRDILQLLNDESRRARRYGTPLALALISIDEFATFRLNEGPAGGEHLLGEVGQLLVRSLREFDLVGRFQADEFLLILPNVRVNDAMIGLERLRELLEATHWGVTAPWLTISGGLTEYSGEEVAALIESLQSLLITARAAGGNRLCVDLEMF